MIILGVDPGVATIGYGAVKYDRNRFSPVGYGIIQTQAKTPLQDRLDYIYSSLEELLDRYKPDFCAVEELFFNTNVKTGIAVAHARGVILLAVRRHNVPFYEYTPLQVKQAVVGYGRAEKKQVMEMTRVLLGLEKIPRPDDAADALAIAICHAHSLASAMFGRNTVL